MLHQKMIFANGTLDDNVHEMIDSSLIASFALTYDEVRVYLLSKRINAIRPLVDLQRSNKNVRYYGFWNFRKTSFYKDIWGAILDAYVLLLKGNKQFLFFYSYSNVFSRYLLNFLSKVTNKDIVVCIHSEMEIVKAIPSKTDNYWMKLMRRFFLKTQYSSHFKLMVLGDNILHNISKYVDKDSLKHYISIDHPYFNSGNFNTHTLNIQNIHIGVVGALTKLPNRGYDNLVDFSKKISEANDIYIHIISKVDKELLKDLPPNLIIDNSTGEYLSKEEYEYKIREMDYLYFSYPKEAFEFTASGAVFEAITNGIPSLMYSNSYFSYLSTKYGEFGYFIDMISPNELFGYLKDCYKYNLLQRKLVDFSKKISPLSISKELQSKCEEVC